MMMTRTNWLMSALVVVAFTGCGLLGEDPTVDDGFSDKDDSSETTRLTGSALTEESEPADEVTVYLRPEEGEVHSTRTDSEGGFNFDEAPVGHVDLVLNDGSGRGALREMTLFADGDNEVGEIELEPLEGISNIVDLHGVGFEERLSSGSADYAFPVFNSDASKVYALRDRHGEYDDDIVELDTDSGAEKVLLEDQSLQPYRGNIVGDRSLGLFADRFVVFSRDEAHETDKLRFDSHETVVYDLDSEEVVFESSSIPAATSRHEPVVTDDALFVFVLVEHDEVDYVYSDGEREAVPYRRHRVVRIDRDSGKATTGPLVEPEEHTSLQEVGRIGDTIFYSVLEVCRENDELRSCYGVHTKSLWGLDTDSLAMERVSEEDSNFHTEVAPEAGTLAWMESDYDETEEEVFQRIVRLNVEDDQRQTTRLEAFGEWSLSPEGDEIVLASYEDEDYEEVPPVRVDLDTGNEEPLGAEVEVDGQSFELCQQRYRCEVDYFDDGALRVVDTFERTPSDWWGAIVDVRDGEVVDQRVVDLLDGDNNYGPAPPTTLLESPNGSREAVLSLDTDTEFSQVHVRGDSDAMIQRTFLTADHEYATFSDAGDELFYFTRDPISGYVQLFRLSLPSLPNIF